jgi:hypothetical protein
MVGILTWSLFQKSIEKKLAKMSHATVPFTIVHCDYTVPKNSKQIFPDMKLRGLVPNSYIHVHTCEHTQVGIGNKVVQFYFWEDKNRIYFSVLGANGPIRDQNYWYNLNAIHLMINLFFS